MCKRLVLLLLVIAMATRGLTEEAEAADQEPTEEEVEEVVFTVEKELVQEIQDAVKTINDIFGNPSCYDDEKDSDGNAQQVEKRGINWRHVGRIFGKKRSTDTDAPVNVEKRGWFKKALKIGAAAYVLGKRSDETDDAVNVEKRGWFKKALKIGAAAYVLGKRSDETDGAVNVEKRGWFKKALKIGAAAYVLGKRSDETDDAVNVEKRGWFKKALKIGGAALLLGKRSEEMEKRGWLKKTIAKAIGKRSLVNKRDSETEKPSAADEDEAVEKAEEVEFRADVNKLENALEVLNEVLAVAELAEQEGSDQ